MQYLKFIFSLFEVRSWETNFFVSPIKTLKEGVMTMNVLNCTTPDTVDVTSKAITAGKMTLPMLQTTQYSRTDSADIDNS